jgi:dissimilatory sulfite reductase (desulfoviridin) alpha/beta subunit
LHTKANSQKYENTPLGWFLTGFADAEGCFRISIIKDHKQKLGWRVRAHFLIHLDQKDLPLLYEIRKQLGVGNVHISSNNDATFEVSRFSSLINVIIPYFDKYPLQSAKSIDYIL